MSVLNFRFRVKRDTDANFTSANTLLLQGEFGLETDTGKFKIGDGSTAWNSLNYYCAVPLADPGADRLLFWDDSAGTWKHLTLGTNLSITDTTINAAGAGGGDGSTIVKPTSESRSSTTTLAADSHLSIELSPGVYHVRFFVMTEQANSTPKLKFAFSFTGTATAHLHYEFGSNAGSAVGGSSGFVSSAVLSFGAVISPGGWPAGTSYIRADVLINVTVLGSLSFDWAQQVSNASAITVLAGSSVSAS